MDKIINIIEVGFALFGALWGILYYTGRINYTGEKEERRKKRVDKYGFILIIGIMMMLFGGLFLFIGTFATGSTGV